MVREAGLTRACLDNPDLRISALRVAQLLEASAAQSGVEAFGLLMVEGRRISNLGLLGLLTREEPTLRQALRSTLRYGPLHNNALAQHIEEAHGLATLHQDLLPHPAGYTRQGIEMVVGVVMRLIKVFLGADWRARRVCFSHPPPRELTVHRRVLGQTPEFNCDFNGIVCTSADLDTPIASADPVMSGYLRQQVHLDKLGRDSVANEVRQMIMLLMPQGRCTVEQIAQLMGVNRRTLHRHLAAENHSHVGLLKTIRCELAQRYVAESHRPLRDVAQLLGFAEFSSFSRWYKTTFNTTAERARLLAISAPNAPGRLPQGRPASSPETAPLKDPA